MAAPAVRATGLAKRFGAVVAVDSVDLAVDTGEVHGLLGPNGAGKTTLLRMLFGLVRPDAGSVRLLGREPAGGTGLAGVGGFVETPRFYPYLSAWRNLELLAALDGGGISQARIGEVLDQVGLDHRRRHRVRTFSTGMGQRLGIAAALLRDPRLLVLDEPTSGLDPAGIRDVRALVRELATGGVTVLVTSHHMDDVEAMCDAVTILRSGRAVYDGTVAALRARAPDPAHHLRTSDDRRALALAADRAGPHQQVVAAADGDGLSVRAGRDALDAYVVALGKAGVAVRELVLRASSLEAVFFELTEDGPDPAPGVTAGAA
jgi:ABC-2 type transport system ATP-binding protein